MTKQSKSIQYSFLESETNAQSSKMKLRTPEKMTLRPRMILGLLARNRPQTEIPVSMRKNQNLLLKFS